MGEFRLDAHIYEITVGYVWFLDIHCYVPDRRLIRSKCNNCINRHKYQ